MVLRVAADLTKTTGPGKCLPLQLIVALPPLARRLFRQLTGRYLLADQPGAGRGAKSGNFEADDWQRL